MKIMYHIRSDYRKNAAGDSLQMEKTVEYINKAGVETSISTVSNVDLSEYDLVHIFNITRIDEAYKFYKNAVIQQKKIVISPIFIDMHDYYKNENPIMFSSWRSANILRREILQGSDLLLPNSEKEAGWIKNILYTDTDYRVIYNGIDNNFIQEKDIDSEWFINKYRIRDFIFCVGRLSPIKNQLSLIKAAKELGLPVVLAGPANDIEYARKCAEEGAGFVKYIPWLDREQLLSAYKAAKVHVQPSYFETVGLSSLEAAAAGTGIIVTKNGAAYEYYKDLAVYVDPYSISDIRNAIKEAYQNSANDNIKIKELQKHVLKNYTWEKAAESTIEAYREILEKPCRSPHERSSRFNSKYEL